MAVDENVLNRVENLLRLANHPGTSQEEAQAAMLAAQRTAARYHLDLEAFSGVPEKPEAVITESVYDAGKLADWRYRVVELVAKNFRCRMYQQVRWHMNKRVSSLMIMGLTTDVALARKVASYALEVADREVVAYAGNGMFNVSGTRKEGMAIRHSWLIGFVHGLKEAFRQQVAANTSMAIMVVVPPPVQQAFTAQHLRSTSVAIRPAYESQAYQNGFQKGRDFTGPVDRLGQ